ncbi:cytochrome P450 [Echria macrotheca]|uniref:Cytochrome P450 n=1 Tax=Echria macrotheca TaxID=438768 RepID=A0AAJ0B734_9PEZI|nr:cytochrome P450 [Echria macrotheca]
MQDGAADDGVSLGGPVGAAVLAVAVSLVLLVFKLAFFPSLDPREPPLARPRVPFVGHILGLIKESASYYARLHKRTRLPICTLPMLNGKLYLINSPSLISAAMRNRDLSFDPFAVEFSVKLLDIEEKWYRAWMEPGWYQSMTDVIHASLTGENLRVMKAACYRELAATLNGYDQTIEIKNAYDWLALIVPRAFNKALFGAQHNPMTDEAIQAIWDFDQGVAVMSYNLFPRLLAPKALAARSLLQKTLLPYYAAGYYKGDDVSALIRGRAIKVLGEDGTPELLAKTEMNLPWAAVTNTVPDLFWLVSNIFSRPHVLERFRAEVGEVMTLSSDDENGGRRGVIDAGVLIERPYLAATYWEVHRIYNEALGNRRVTRDTTIADPADGGREYFLKKGTNVQWAVGPPHRDTAVWGDDAEVFRPERWVEASAAQERAQNRSMFPFGGGRNLCPGKAFAISESLALVAVLAVGFELDGVRLPASTPPLVSAAMRRPYFGKGDWGFKLSRRRGWEDVTWSFKLDS